MFTFAALLILLVMLATQTVTLPLVVLAVVFLVIGAVNNERRAKTL